MQKGRVFVTVLNDGQRETTMEYYFNLDTNDYSDIGPQLIAAVEKSYAGMGQKDKTLVSALYKGKNWRCSKVEYDRCAISQAGKMRILKNWQEIQQ